MMQALSNTFDPEYSASDLKEIRGTVEAQNSKPKAAILWGPEDMLSSAVEVLLSQQSGWQVTRLSDQHSIQTFIKIVEMLKPDVVIIHQGDCAAVSDLPMKILQINPGSKVITLSLENNSMEVYHKQKVCVKEVSDLLLMVEG